MTHVERDDPEAKSESGSSDHKILEGDDVPFGGLLSFDPARDPRNLERDWINEQGLENSFSKNAATLAVLFGSGAIHAVRKLDYANRR